MLKSEKPDDYVHSILSNTFGAIYICTGPKPDS